MSWFIFINKRTYQFNPSVWLARLRLQLFVARRRHGSLSRNVQEELEAALHFSTLFTEVPAPTTWVARCSSRIHKREQRTSLHNWLPPKPKWYRYQQWTLAHSWHRKQRINPYVGEVTQQSDPYSLASARVHTKQTVPLPFQYTGCPRRNVPDFGRVFLMLKYTDITQNTYVQSWTVTEIMAREKLGLLAVPNTATCTADTSRDKANVLDSGMQCSLCLRDALCSQSCYVTSGLSHV